MVRVPVEGDLQIHHDAQVMELETLRTLLPIEVRTLVKEIEQSHPTQIKQAMMGIIISQIIRNRSEMQLSNLEGNILLQELQQELQSIRDSRIAEIDVEVFYIGENQYLSAHEKEKFVDHYGEEVKSLESSTLAQSKLLESTFYEASNDEYRRLITELENIRNKGWTGQRNHQIIIP